MTNPIRITSATPTTEPSTQARSGGKVDAPGKKHRKPPASSRGVKHSDEMIAKANASEKKLGRNRNRG